jgi:hypothetical protein
MSGGVRIPFAPLQLSLQEKERSGFKPVKTIMP